MTLQGLLFSIDVALAPLMLRDIARAAQHGRQHIVHLRFLRIYGSIALGAFVLGQLAVLGFQHPPVPSIAPLADGLDWAIRLVLVQFLFQFSNNAAIGFWNGQERQRYANLRLAGFTLAKHGLALLLISRYSGTATMYLAPFAVISMIEFFLNFRRVQFEVRCRNKDVPANQPKPSSMVDEAEAASGWRAFVGFGLAASLGLLTTQIDRIFLSLTLPAEQYGVYFIIGTLTLSLLQLQVPIYRAFLPRMATANSAKKIVAAMLKVSLSLLTLPCLTMAVFSEMLLKLWLHDDVIAVTGATPLRLILLGVAMTALYAPFNLLLISQHRYRTLSLINGTVFLVQLLVLVAFTPAFGITAGAMAWLGCGMVQVSFAIFIWCTARDQHPLQMGMPS